MLLSPSLVGSSMSVKQAVLLARRHNSSACLPKACAPVAIAAKLLVLTVAGPRRLLPTSLLSLEGTCSTYRTTRTFSYTANIVICFLSFVNRKIPRRHDRRQRRSNFLIRKVARQQKSPAAGRCLRRGIFSADESHQSKSVSLFKIVPSAARRSYSYSLVPFFSSME